MILKASERGGARKLALHLLNTEDNDHVEVHEVRGFMSQDLINAFHEIYAISKGTRCSNFFYSLILSPPEEETVANETYLEVVDQVEKSLALNGQPRAIVFHEKKGRRHAHAVWSRIDVQQMKAINLPHYKNKLMVIARQQYIKHGWKMPNGFIRANGQDPTNYTVKEHYQAKQSKKNAGEVKQVLQDAWGVSDNKASYIHALRERGYWLARGDRGRYIVIDHLGTPYAVAKWTGLKVKDVRQRLGDASELHSVQEAKAAIAKEMKPHLRQLFVKAKEQYRDKTHTLVEQLNTMRERQRIERQLLVTQQRTRFLIEQQRRQSKFKRGLAGLWSRLNGDYRRIRLRNEEDMQACDARDNKEKQLLRTEQLSQRRKLQVLFVTYRKHYQILLQDIHQDIARHTQDEKHAHEVSEEQTEQQGRTRPRRRRRRKQEQEQDFGM